MKKEYSVSMSMAIESGRFSVRSEWHNVSAEDPISAIKLVCKMGPIIGSDCWVRVYEGYDAGCKLGCHPVYEEVLTEQREAELFGWYKEV
jgi:hypothetical protein